MKSDRHQLRVITRAIDGDAEAFVGLCYRYTDALYRYLYFRLGTVLAAEEVCAQVFVRAWERLPSDPRQEVMSFTAWLFLIANDVVMERNERFAEAGLHPVRPPLINWSEANKQELVERSSLYPRYLAQAVMQLDEVSQQVILLRFVLRLSHRDTGMIIGDTGTGSRVLQYRALLEVREQLTREKMSEQAYASEHVGAVTFCLDRIIGGRWNARDCFEHLTDESDRIEQILRFAVLVRGAVTIRPRQMFGKELRQQLPTELQKSKRKPVNRPRLWRWFQSASERIPAPVVAAFLLGLILFFGAASGRGIAIAVDSSAPGDPLYQIDLRLERAYRALLTNPETQFQVTLSATEERLNEAETLARRGDSEGLQIALVAYSVEVAALAESELLATSVNDLLELDRHFAEQQQQLDKVYSTALTTLAPSEASESPDVVCDAQAHRHNNWHPVGLSIAAQHEISYSELLSWVCDGHSFGAILLALATSDRGADHTVEVMQLKSELGGWGQLWQEMSVDDTLLNVDEENTNGLGTLGGEVQRPPTREVPPTRLPAAPTPEITPLATTTATPRSSEDDSNAEDEDDEFSPTTESGPPDASDLPGSGPPDDPGPPDWVDPPGGGPPDDPGPPDDINPPGGGPPHDPGPPDDVNPPGGGPPENPGPPGGGPPGNDDNPGNSGNSGGGRP